MKKRILAGAAIMGSLVFIGASFAWYSFSERTAESETVTVMKPYNLFLTNPSETDMLQLSIGSMLLGETKQIVFCVNNGNEEDATEFDYSMELIYTNNLALDYEIYELETAADEATAYIVAEDIVIVNGEPQANRTYWDTKTGAALIGKDISAKRHEEVALNGDEVNSGTYILYEGIDNGGSSDLHLSAADDEVRAQYFVMEIKWRDGIVNYDDYEKETDMIYLLVRAVQPKPEKKN